jgi:single-stranded-DNA-specific exonuclease
MKKFKYKLKKDPINIQSNNYLEDYLRKLGIKKVKSFTATPSRTDEDQPILLDNIDTLTKELKYGFDNDRKFFLQVDSDADGYTSAAIFYNYFKKLYPEANIVWRLHEEKEHGVIVDTVPDDTDYVIIPDAGSNQYEEQLELMQKGIKVLIMDHHHADDFIEIENVIVVNNQLSKKFRNKDLSGAGIVFKVVQYFSKLYSDGEDYKEFTDLAALGIISDMMDTRNLDNNFIIHHGLRSINSKIFEALLSFQEYSISSMYNPSKIDVAFYITPIINGVIRAGSEDEKDLLFRSFIDATLSREIYEREYNGRTYRENFYEMVARTSANVKDKQNREKEKAMQYIDQKIQESEYVGRSIVLAVTSKDDDIVVPKTMTGLVAMELVKKYGKPTLVVRPKVVKNEVYLFGSGRAATADGFESFRDILNKSQYTHFAQGHDNAFGFGIKLRDVDRFLDDMDRMLDGVDFESETIEVDYVFEKNRLHAALLKEFADAMPIYGNGIAQPKFAFKMVLSRDHFTVMGKEKNVVRIDYKDMSFLKFRDTDLVQYIENGMSEIVEVEMIGRSQNNEFRGQKKLQIIIDNIRITKADTSALL